MDYPTKEKPTGLVPFDTDTHIALVTKYVADVECGMFHMNQVVCNQNAKAHGMRLGFDLIQIKSLLNPERNSIYLTIEPTYCGKEIPTELGSTEIAGVLNDELWFENHNLFYPTSFDLEMRKKMQQRLAAPLKEAFKDLERTLRDLHKEDDEGEDWKKE